MSIVLGTALFPAIVGWFYVREWKHKRTHPLSHILAGFTLLAYLYAVTSALQS